MKDEFAKKDYALKIVKEMEQQCLTSKRIGCSILESFMETNDNLAALIKSLKQQTSKQLYMLCESPKVNYICHHCRVKSHIRPKYNKYLSMCNY